ncbi:MFS transporter [Sphingomonas sp. Y38-1Y]|uniref:MFS transporter n=1 Tax=Sphingomonas sp. Y38-1Y TaxID=3078265 RepID=UPI0028EB819D|nr:MFS transporter [Sphingomonas sp. Y38-1Y]
MILMLTLTMFIALTVGGLGAPLLEPIKSELGMTDLQIGLLGGFAALIPTLLLSLPVAYLVDHGTRVRILAVLAAVWASGTIGMAFVTDFATLFIAKLVSGIGGATAGPVLISLMADVTAPEKRGRSMLLISVGAWAGVAAAFAVGGSLYGFFDKNPGSGLLGLSAWREVHLLAGLVALAAGLPYLIFREPPRYEVERTEPSVRESLSTLWQRRGFLGPMLVAQLTGGLAEGAAGIWMGAILVRQYGLAPGDFGVWIGGIIVASGLAGSIIGGFASDAARKLRMRGGVLLPAFIATALTVPAGAFSIMPTASGFGWMLFALLTGGSLVTLVCSSAIALLIPNEDRALTLAGMGMISKVAMTGIAPAAIGWVASNSEGTFGLGQSIAVLGVVTGAISTIGFWYAMRNAPIEVARDPGAKMIPADA